MFQYSGKIDWLAKFFERELLIMREIKHHYGKGFPKMLAHGFQEDLNSNYLVSSYFDVNIGQLFLSLNRTIQLQTTINIGIQLVSKLLQILPC